MTSGKEKRPNPVPWGAPSLILVGRRETNGREDRWGKSIVDAKTTQCL